MLPVYHKTETDTRPRVVPGVTASAITVTMILIKVEKMRNSYLLLLVCTFLRDYLMVGCLVQGLVQRKGNASVLKFFCRSSSLKFLVIETSGMDQFFRL